jgi:hypothetical protein
MHPTRRQGAAVDIVSIHAGRLKAKLGSPDGAHVATWSASYDDNIKHGLHLQQETGRVFDGVLDRHQERDSPLTVDDPVVVG